jgi:Tfp pilus assembly protein PilO
MKQIIPIILIAASVGIFVFFTNGQYQNIKVLQKDIAGYESALGKSKQVLLKREELQNKYKQFSNSDLVYLTKMLPDHVDNVQLILDINGIARKHGMSIGRIQINQDQPNNTSAPIGPNTAPYASILVSFRTIASYESFVSFIKDLEQGLRLVDVTDLVFKADQKGQNEYAVTIRTYWLK